MIDYDPKKQSTFIPYLGMNNLHGWEMNEYLPYEWFKWLKNADEFDVMSFSEINLIGYVLEVDLKSLDKLHEFLEEYPPAADKFAVSSDMLSKYCKKIADK